VGSLIFNQQYHAGAGTQQRVVIQQPQIARVVVTLGSGADTSAIDNLSINTPVPLNHPPAIDPIPDQTIDNTNPLQLTVHAPAPPHDQHAPPHHRLPARASRAPAAIQIDAVRGLLRRPPPAPEVAHSSPVTVPVSDAGAPRLSATRTFPVTVRDPIPPVVVSFS